jgi:hypothetical protein
MSDPDGYDAKIAGWWVWGQCCWIGSGWCSGKGPWHATEGGWIDNRKLPHFGGGRGVNRKLPHFGGGRGVNRQLPHFGGGRGVNRQLPHFGGGREHLFEYFEQLRDRLRNVQVCCGDWSRVVTRAVTTGLGVTGVVLDPPYADLADRIKDCYATDSLTVAHDVQKWAIENGNNPDLRIVLCGYEGEHAMPDDWRVVSWKAVGGYGGAKGKESKSGLNSNRERLWFSPNCPKPEAAAFELVSA